MVSVPHTSELDFVYGSLGTLNESVSSNVLSEMMIDYWVLFATSLDPNDGLGTSRKFSAVLTYAYDFLSPPRTSLAAVYSRG